MIILFYSSNNEVSEQVYNEYIFAASHFKEKQTHLTQKVGKDMRRPIFFAALKFTQDTMRIYRDLDFRGVPNVLISDPKEVSFKDPLDRYSHLNKKNVPAPISMGDPALRRSNNRKKARGLAIGQGRRQD